jgi:alpha-tubulin suppressor-like RCC1 family protein
MHTCARRSDNRLYCWGNDASGQVGNGAVTGDVTSPTEVAGNTTDWAGISLGSIHTCGRKTTGRLFCWGNDATGRLGDGVVGGAPLNRTSPNEVVGAATDWANVGAGSGHTCARKTSGRLFCWGSDDNGQLGNGGTNTNTGTPTEVAGALMNWDFVEAGSYFTCGVRTTGRLFCWGADLYGQLGNGPPNAAQGSPVQVAGARTDWVGVMTAQFHTCARTTIRRIFCWGGDSSGQLGDGPPNADQSGPVQVNP